jgi:hypothetical protein
LGNTTASNSSFDRPLNLKAGDWVEVRAAAEILATLDSGQALNGLVFMPEMLAYCGRRFRVFKAAHKTCDTIRTYSIRRMRNTVHLDELRCDGSGHDGCQAGCLFFWKEAWLKRAPAPASGTGAVGAGENNEALPLIRPEQLAVLSAATRAPQPAGDGEPRYRCQATDLLQASTEVRRRGRWNPLLYWPDLASRNITLWEFVRFGAMGMFNAFTDRWMGRRYPHMCGNRTSQTPAASLDLKPGDLVQVRSREEILATVNQKLLNRGLSFDVEMTPYCGKQYRVLRRVEKIVDERTGRMLRMNTPSLILDGVTCTGYRSSNRLFCPRNLYPFWREVWLERADESAHAEERQRELTGSGAQGHA